MARKTTLSACLNKYTEVLLAADGIFTRMHTIFVSELFCDTGCVYDRSMSEYLQVWCEITSLAIPTGVDTSRGLSKKRQLTKLLQ